MWRTGVAALVVAGVTEVVAFYKVVICAVGDTNIHYCDGLRGGGETVSEIVLLGVPAAAVAVMVGVWKERRGLVLFPLVALAAALAWALSVGAGGFLF